MDLIADALNCIDILETLSKPDTLYDINVGLMLLSKNFSLKNYNTFGFDVKARFFVAINSPQDLDDFFSSKKDVYPYLVLGGGSNLLFKTNFEGYVLHINIKGVNILKKDADCIIINVGAGEDWDGFVDYCVQHKYGGVENLSLIPGLVGASPIQNIGAYGVEVKDTIMQVNTFNVKQCTFESFTGDACAFGYRSSIFKTVLKDTHIITDVTFSLSLKPKINTTYSVLEKELALSGKARPDIKDVREAVCKIRQSKLPEPEELGNAGSFFKNPIISLSHYNQLLEKEPDIPAYTDNNKGVKIAAAWLIEQCGWKGKRFGDAGVHINQALVLVNYGKASGNEMLCLAQKIKESVFNTFGIELEYEVNIV